MFSRLHLGHFISRRIESGIYRQGESVNGEQRAVFFYSEDAEEVELDVTGSVRLLGWIQAWWFSFRDKPN